MHYRPLAASPEVAVTCSRRTVSMAVLALILALSVATMSAAAGKPPPAVVELAATGDIAMAPSGSGAASFFDRLVRHGLTAGVSLGNLEGTLATGGSSKCGPSSTDCFAFRAPPSYARALRHAGFTIMNLANNHALDYGAQGQAETIAALRRAHLRYTGLPGQITHVRQGRTKIALVGFAPYPWAQSLLDIGDAVRIVRRAERKADVVIVTMHAGAEGSDHQHVRPGSETFLGEPRGNVMAFTHAVVRAGADLVVGHGPHVLRGLEWYHGRVIAYSLGNFLGNGTLSVSGPTGESAILRAVLKGDGSWGRGAIVPVRLDGGGLPHVDSAKGAFATLRRLSREDFDRNAVRVTAAGKLLPPAWRTG
jgi:hypothetical protein